jgi:hypothetical protein
MRTRIIVGAALLMALFGVGTYASRASEVSGVRQWTIVNFMEPTVVKNAVVMGPVLIVHDSAKMARGEPCTTFYQFEPGKGPKDALVSFHCQPQARAAVARTTFSYSDSRTPAGCKRLLSYQIAGDAEAHGIPTR